MQNDEIADGANKEFLSTGELAQICHFAKHTIIAAIEKGDLRASQTPGGHNRIAREDAISFMRRHNLVPQEARKILVVDDEDFIAEIVTQLFDGEPVAIRHAKNGYEAGKLAERERPDLILLDILLPDIDGRDVCRHIREEEFGKTCRILAVTALKDPEDVKAIYAAGIDDYIAKPFQIEVLKDKIEHLLSVHAEA